MLRNQKGFTLIEVIAVLVILGILSAVAIPKYFDLQNEARTAACWGAVGAAQSSISIGYAANLLGKSGAPATPVAACNSTSVSSQGGALNLTCTGGGNWSTNVVITAAYGSQNATANWVAP
jgi:MSHA pilin protein MshA